MDFHPLAGLFPLVEGKAFDDLVSDIKANGLAQKIVTYQDKILDGRNRFRACEAAKVTPAFTAYDGKDPIGVVLSANLHRRHLTESQRSAVAAKLATMTVGGDKRSDHSANLPNDISQSKAAEMLNVSTRSVTAAKKVQEQGSPELAKAVESGSVSVAAAAKVATLPKKDQAKIVAGGAKAIKEAAKEIAAKPKPGAPVDPNEDADLIEPTEVERQPGEDDVQIIDQIPKDRMTPEDKAIDVFYGKLIRAVDTKARVLFKGQGKNHAACIAALHVFFNAAKLWRERGTP